MENSEDEGEDLNENVEQDYRAMPALDRYDEQDIDNEDYSLSPGARLAAEEEMGRRDRDGRNRRGPRALNRNDDMDDIRPTRRRREMEAAAGLNGSTRNQTEIHELPHNFL